MKPITYNLEMGGTAGLLCPGGPTGSCFVETGPNQTFLKGLEVSGDALARLRDWNGPQGKLV